MLFDSTAAFKGDLISLKKAIKRKILRLNQIKGQRDMVKSTGIFHSDLGFCRPQVITRAC